MKKTIFIIIILFSSINIFGQKLAENIILTEGSDTTSCFNSTFEQIDLLNLISTNSNEDFIRISNDSFVLELSEKSNKIYFYAEGCDDEIFVGKNFVGKKFIDNFKLKEKQIQKVRLLLDTMNINNIPSDKFIENWKQGFDGIEYIIEIKQGNNYSFKHYWTPDAQKNCNEAIIIQNFINEMYKMIDYKYFSSIFYSEIPFDCVTNGSSVAVRVKTETNIDKSLLNSNSLPKRIDNKNNKQTKLKRQ